MDSASSPDLPPDKLPDDPERYFVIAPDTPLVELPRLLPTRARPEGIAKAAEYMWAAYQGLIPRRAPLDVVPQADGNYAIHDGNSTFAVALQSGWAKLPVRIVNDKE